MASSFQISLVFGAVMSGSLSATTSNVQKMLDRLKASSNELMD
ncbi:hypothetical protein ACFBZI_08785 [Moraxella sp. ZJ142]